MQRKHDVITPPEQLPEPGFYYHYKHDPNGPFNNYAYLILGTGVHTEEDARPEDAFMQVYTPLYEEAPVYVAGKMFDVRPLGMAVGDVHKDGYDGPRFIRITDESLIEKLKEQGRKMYGPWYW